MKPYYPICLDIDGRPCLVIGGGEEATDKTKKLLAAQAVITLVSPTLTDELRSLAQEGCFTYHPRHFRPSDVDGMFLVLNTVKTDPALSREVYRLSEKRRFLLNTYDRPAYSNFAMPAIVRRGLLCIAISTSGASPALSRRIREDLEHLFDEQFEAYLDWLADLRETLTVTEPDPLQRIQKLIAVVAGFHLIGELHYPEEWDRSNGKTLSPTETEAEV